MVFSQADVQSRALVDFDQLLSQKNYRQILDDRMRFIAATSIYPEKQEQLRKMLEDMQVIETSIIQAQEIEKRGDYAGAWESAEKAFRNFQDDNSSTRSGPTSPPKPPIRPRDPAGGGASAKRPARLQPRLVSQGSE